MNRFKSTLFLVLFLGVNNARSFKSFHEDVEGSETSVPIGLGSNFIDHYGGNSFIGGRNNFGGNQLGYQNDFGAHQGLGGIQSRHIRNGFSGGVGSFHGGGGNQGFDTSLGGNFGYHGSTGSINGGGLINGGSLGRNFGNGGYHGSTGSINGLGNSGYHGSIHGGSIINHHPHGGEIIDQSSYNSGKKNLEDGSFEKSSGNRIAELSQGENGFTQGKVGQQSSKGDLGYFNDQQAAKKLQEDGKIYNGAQQFNQQGQNANENKQQLGHKKGHVVKGFKSSHHKDETGKTEEFYDEAHDEGDNFNFRGQNGKYGEGSQLSVKGGHDDSFYNADERKKQGHYDGQQYINKNNADQGQYGQNKYIGNGQIYGVNNGVDQQALLGHQEHNRLYKQHPYYSHFY
nr:hornerin-like [Onthophagus taurus]